MICAYKIHHTNTSQLIWNNNIRSIYVGIIRVGSGKYPISKLGLESAENGLFGDFLRFPAPKVYTPIQKFIKYGKKNEKKNLVQLSFLSHFTMGMNART